MTKDSHTAHSVALFNIILASDRTTVCLFKISGSCAASLPLLLLHILQYKLSRHVKGTSKRGLIRLAGLCSNMLKAHSLASELQCNLKQ